jgi:hypothetical protein
MYRRIGMVVAAAGGLLLQSRGEPRPQQGKLAAGVTRHYGSITGIGTDA